MFKFTPLLILLILPIVTIVVSSQSADHILTCNSDTSSGIYYSTTVRDSTSDYTVLPSPLSLFTANSQYQSAAINLNFPFKFYNNIYNSIIVSTNGNIQFTNNNNNNINTPLIIDHSNYSPLIFPNIPNQYRPSILVYHTELILNQPIKYQITGNTGNHILYIQYNCRAGNSINNGELIQIELQLYESNNNIKFNYINIPYFPLSTVTVGLIGSTINRDGTLPATLVINNRSPTYYELDNREILFNANNLHAAGAGDADTVAAAVMESCPIAFIPYYNNNNNNNNNNNPYYNNNNHNNNSGSIGSGAIVGIIFGIILVSSIIIAGTVRYCRARRQFNQSIDAIQFTQPQINYSFMPGSMPVSVSAAAAAAQQSQIQAQSHYIVPIATYHPPNQHLQQ